MGEALQASQAVSVAVDTDQGVSRCWILIKRGVLTHDVIPIKVWKTLVRQPDIIRDTRDAYGYTDVRVRKFIPTNRDVSNMMPVMSWLTWLKNQKGHGERDFKVIWARARGVPWWYLATRFGRSENTMRRWFDGAITEIYSHFDLEVWTMELPAGIWT